MKRKEGESKDHIDTEKAGLVLDDPDTCDDFAWILPFIHPFLPQTLRLLGYAWALYYRAPLPRAPPFTA